MPLKLVCPNCRADVRLVEPLPLPGAAIACERCGTAIAVTYPSGVIDQLKSRGKRFADAARRETTGPIPIGPSTGPVPSRVRDTPPPRESVSHSSPAPSHQRFAAGSARLPSASLPTAAAPEETRARSASSPGMNRSERFEPGKGNPRRYSSEPSGDPSTDTASRSRMPQDVEDDAALVDESAGTEGSLRLTRSSKPEPPPVVERTVGGMRSPYGALPNNTAEPEAGQISDEPSDIDEDDSLDPPETQAAPMVRSGSNSGRSKAPAPVGRTPAPTPNTTRDRRVAPEPASRGAPPPSPAARQPAKPEARDPRSKTPAPQGRTKAPSQPPAPSRVAKSPPAPRTQAPKSRGRIGAITGAVGCLGSMGVMGLGGGALVLVAGVLAAFGGYWWFSQDLPTVEHLRAYKPPTVTIVEDRNGALMGEIFEEKRYVVPIDQIPVHVKQAFMAAEDANFYNHGGIDYMGIVRAMGRNALKGRFAQGASTITQQTAKNFLLTNQKTIDRKVKEVLLSWRIEEAYDKDHILFLYLNQIFLGAQSYGVEAASRTYFGKHVQDITIAEAAILAGLPQRPSDYSPYKGWNAARARQEYVIGQMVSNNFITEAQAKEALAEEVKISSRENKFRSKAPWFTEHVRRYLVDHYGKDKVLYEGLTVRTTCDLELQTIGQKAVRDGVYDTDWRMGYRRKGVTNVGKGNIAKTREEMESKLRKGYAEEKDPAGRVPVPDKSVLEVGRIYEAVIVETSQKWAKLGIGAHDAMLSVSNNDWIYEPDPTRSWRGRTATDLTALVDTDGDKKRDTPILMAGDIVKVTVEALTTSDPSVAKYYSNTPSGNYVAIKMFQVPEVESGLLSMDVATGAVRTMVGGSDFDKSEFNRTVQARRQVGSTFKPLVYAAAVESKRATAATLFADAPIAISADKFIWKPSNYDTNYEGNMTLRTALQKSKNTVTVRVLETADPGMNGDVIYKFGRRLGIGGPPTHTLPADHVRTPKNDLLCPWIKEERDFKLCMDRYPAKDPNLSDAEHRAKLKPGDEYWCRACDMSMGLGSASLTMEEMVRAYSAFATGGLLVEPYYVEEVKDRDGNVLEQHTPATHHRVMDPAVATIATWLLEGVVNGGTASQAGSALKLNALAGKTGTTNDEKDAWFVGFTNDVITAVWFGYDQPQTLGVSSTGGRTALPVWIEYMKAAAPRSKDRPFPQSGNISWVQIDESTGNRVTSGGVSYPFLEGTVPESSGMGVGDVGVGDIQ